MVCSHHVCCWFCFHFHYILKNVASCFQSSTAARYHSVHSYINGYLFTLGQTRINSCCCRNTQWLYSSVFIRVDVMGDDETEATTLSTPCMVIMERMDCCCSNVMDERCNFHQRNTKIVLIFLQQRRKQKSTPLASLSPFILINESNRNTQHVLHRCTLYT